MDSTLFGRFRAGALRHPEAIALEVAGEAVRYRELLDLVERLASRLVEAAGRRPVTVGLLASRSLAAYAGYLATLRLGATVVPLGVEAPVARNTGVCRASTVDIVVADEAGARQARELAAAGGAVLVTLAATGGTPWYWTLSQPPWSQPDPAGPDGLAYIVFTSGSTGEPKGVPIRHRHIDAYLSWSRDRYELGPGGRFGQAAELTFDQAVFGMFLTWGAGATLVVPRPEELLAPSRLVTTRRLTHWYSVPSVISIAHGHGTLPPGSMPELRWSLFGGEQLTVTAARAWAAAAPGSIIENRYGPSELAVCCASYRLPADPAQWPVTINGTVPIGPVHEHLESIVLTADGRPGTEGELCVRGPQRFDGYLDPAQNLGRFVHVDGGARPVENSVVPTAAWYRTGDRVSTTNGTMVHRGRLDHQVKIRGHRVELGEIEVVLRTHPELVDVVALATPASTLQVVYTGEPVAAAELAALAGERLPPYMRPERYQWLERLPVNAHGKVDRLRLAAELAADGG